MKLIKLWEKYPQTSQIDSWVVYFSFQYGASHTKASNMVLLPTQKALRKSGDVRQCLQNMMTYIYTQHGHQREATWCFLDICNGKSLFVNLFRNKIIQIGINKTYSTEFIQLEHHYQLVWNVWGQITWWMHKFLFFRLFVLNYQLVKNCFPLMYTHAFIPTGCTSSHKHTWAFLRGNTVYSHWPIWSDRLV